MDIFMLIGSCFVSIFRTGTFLSLLGRFDFLAVFFQFGWPFQNVSKPIGIFCLKINSAFLKTQLFSLLDEGIMMVAADWLNERLLASCRHKKGLPIGNPSYH